jgi:hypothetical protein
MDLLFQIKARVLIQRKMENLPFLTGNEPQLKNDQSERRPQWAEVEEVPQWVAPPPALSILDSFKNNQIALVLLGVVLGVIIMNMRPIIINPK